MNVSAEMLKRKGIRLPKGAVKTLQSAKLDVTKPIKLTTGSTIPAQNIMATADFVKVKFFYQRTCLCKRADKDAASADESESGS